MLKQGTKQVRRAPWQRGMGGRTLRVTPRNIIAPVPQFAEAMVSQAVHDKALARIKFLETSNLELRKQFYRMDKYTREQDKEHEELNEVIGKLRDEVEIQEDLNHQYRDSVVQTLKSVLDKRGNIHNTISEELIEADVIEDDQQVGTDCDEDRIMEELKEFTAREEEQLPPPTIVAVATGFDDPNYRDSDHILWIGDTQSQQQVELNLSQMAPDECIPFKQHRD